MTPFSLAGLLNILTAVPLGLVVLFYQPRKLVGKLYALFLFVVSSWGVGIFFIGLGLTGQKALWVWRFSHISVAFISVLIYHVVYQLCRLRNQKILVAVYAFGILTSLLFTFSDIFIQGVHPLLGFYFPICGRAYFFFLAGWTWVAVLANYELWKAHKVAVGIEKNRLGLFRSTALGFLGGALTFLPILGVGVYPWGNFAIPVAALIQAYAVFVYKLMDVEIFVKKTLSYSVLAALITALYLVVVLIMEKWFQGFFGYRSLIATLFVAFLISISFNPVRSRIQAFVDRAIFKATPEELVAQRDKLLQEVRKSEQMKAVGTLAAGLAHEIKNPLASIKTFTDYLKERYDDPVFRAKFQKIVGGEVERINLIVQQLLDFAKPVPPKLAPVEIAGLLDETVELLSGECVERRVQVNRSYVERAFVLGDPQQLKQLFLNLLLNSLDAINGLGIVDIQTHIEGAELVICITDNGCGIAPKDLPYIFDPFFTTKETGTGLGLPIVQGILSEHRGRIQVNSQPGQGTTFTLHLPIAV